SRKPRDPLYSSRSCVLQARAIRRSVGPLPSSRLAGLPPMEDRPGAVRARRSPPAEAFGRGHQKAFFEDPPDRLPVYLRLQAHPDPSFWSHVRRYEKALGVRAHEDFLHHRRCLHPNADVPAVMMIAIGHREHAAAVDPKSAFPPRFLLEHLRQLKTHLAQPPDQRTRIVIHPGMSHGTKS